MNLDNDQKIEGGFFIIARSLFEHRLMNKPPLNFKLWAWMLFKANFKDHGKLKRGQLLTSIEEMREAMSYLVGYRKEKPSRDEIRNCYEAFAKTTMITTAKTTRGMIITILNYDKYQNPKNYETHSENHNENTAKTPVGPHYKGMNEKKEKTNISKKALDRFIKDKAIELYELYSRKADRKNSLKSIENILRTYPIELLPCPVTGLKAVIENYRKTIETEGTEKKFIIQSNNFFGQAERWREHLAPMNEGGATPTTAPEGIWK